MQFHSNVTASNPAALPLEACPIHFVLNAKKDESKIFCSSNLNIFLFYMRYVDTYHSVCIYIIYIMI